MTLAEKVDYHRYMASREWALKKEEVKERARGFCERCRSAPVQNVQHLTYARLGHEVVNTDLLGLCRPCHEFASGKRDDDPAVAVIYALMEVGDMKLLWFKDFKPPHPYFEVGPTVEGLYFHCHTETTSVVERTIGSDYIIDKIVVVPMADGVWLHCWST